MVILKGTILWSKSMTELSILENGYLVGDESGQVEGVYPVLPERFSSLPVEDYGSCLIIPGLVDLHVHAPQYSYRATGMDLELLEWLETYTFPEESKFVDTEYAKTSYSIFVENLKRGATTRAVIFATLHRPATLVLMDLLENTGLKTMVGKVNMDRNCPDFLREETPFSLSETRAWIEEASSRGYKNTRPILTPRFTPTCSDELMEGLKEIQTEYHLPFQSHLSENLEEIAWVKELCPWAQFYGEAYDRFGLFGKDCPTIMAHCVYSDEKEIARMKENGVYIAHCPESNANIASGIAPVRTYLNVGIPVGLGSDVAGGTTENLFSAMAMALQVSKLRWRILDESLAPLSVEEAFYLGTRGGASFFGDVGTFTPGFAFDAVVLDDSRLKTPLSIPPKGRLERLIYLSDEREVRAKYVEGKKVL